MDRRVLVIDDDRNVGLTVSEFLHRKGYRVSSAVNGKEGLRAAGAYIPDLIILDIAMPGMDGFEVLRALKKSPRTVSIPVIMLTARMDDEAYQWANQLYSEYYLTKPCSMEDLESRIKKALDKSMFY